MDKKFINVNPKQYDLQELQNLQNNLQNQITELKKQKEEIDKQIYKRKYNKNKMKLENLRKNKTTILDLFHHNYTTCSDENPCNGDNLEYRCAKCFLIHILNDECDNYNNINLTFDVYFDRIR